MSQNSKAIIISACDDQYFTLARDLFSSICSQKFAADFDLGVLDLGLSPEKIGWFEAENIRIVKAGVDIEYPARSSWEATKPGFRAMTSRPYLRRYFPGYDVYMWFDSDIWVQTPAIIDALIAAASATPAIHLAVEFDRCYGAFFRHAGIWQILRNWYSANFGEDIAGAMTLKPMLNSGMWAMRHDSPVWESWAGIFSEAVQAFSTGFVDHNFMIDQLSLNIALYLKKMPHVILPASCNWMTSYALPMFDAEKGLYVEPLPPHWPIGQLHLTQVKKEQVERIECLDGNFIERPLTYRAASPVSL